MKYKCLVLDHDDTVVDSTATVHFPCFLEYLQKKYPLAYQHGYTLEEYFIKNFDPGIESLFHDEIGLSEEEMAAEVKYWSEYVKTHIPKVYPGMRELLWEEKEAGVLLCVSSHSYSEHILRDYRANQLPEPDMIFGWELPREQRKPFPYSLNEIMKQFHLKPEEILMLDDLKPGYDMAKATGVPFAAAGWAYDIPEIENYMRKNCDYYFKNVDDLRRHLKEA